MLAALWRFRFFVLTSIVNDFRVRFGRSLLGGLWTILNPLAMVAIYAVVLSNVLQARIGGIEGKYAFAVYLTAGLLCWNLFNQIVSQALTLFIRHGNLIKKAAFPRTVLPAVLSGTCLVDSLGLMLATLAVYALVGHSLSPTMLLVPFLLLLVAGFALGIGLLVGVLNVFMRDIGQVVPIVLQLGFWFTPIVYPATIIPERVQPLLLFNPVYYFVSLFHDTLVYTQMPDISTLAIACALTLVSLLLGLACFRKANEDLTDAL
jgi:lipopolysaccharide transport system permease protein